MRRCTFLLPVLLCACGAASTGATDPSRLDCGAARAQAQAAWADLAGDAERAATPEREPLAAERVLDRINAHVAALEAGPREVGGDEALALSSAVMDAIDALALPSAIRDRADEAAEGLLTDRSEEGSLRAAREAAEAMSAVVEASQPGALEGREQRRALSALSGHARSAADAYGEGDVDEGDRHAGRAEAVALDDQAPSEVRDGLERASQASGGVRRACGASIRTSSGLIGRRS